MAKTKEWTGAEVRKLRESLHLTRKEFAQYLNVSAVAIEKWELAPEKKILPKYHSILSSLGGGKTAGAVLGILAAPTVLAPLAIAGGMGLALDVITNRGLKDSLEKLEQLSKLNEEERATLVRLWTKMRK